MHALYVAENELLSQMYHSSLPHGVPSDKWLPSNAVLINDLKGVVQLFGKYSYSI